MFPGGLLHELNTICCTQKCTVHTHNLPPSPHAHMRIKIPSHFEMMSERIHHGDSTTSTHFSVCQKSLS